MAQKIAFITGGNRGIGFQTALDLKDAGIKVVIGSRDLAQGEEAVEKLRAAGVDADAIQFDITKPADFKAAYDYFNSKYGHLDILINNAGIAAGTFPGTAPSTRAGRSQPICFTRSSRQTFSHPSRSPKPSCPCLRKAPRAASSISPASWVRSYTPGRPQVTHLRRQVFRLRCLQDGRSMPSRFTCAYELRNTNIKVNSAHPGWVKTDMGGDQAAMESKDGAKTSVALATLPENGPTGGYFHLGKPLPW